MDPLVLKVLLGLLALYLLVTSLHYYKVSISYQILCLCLGHIKSKTACSDHNCIIKLVEQQVHKNNCLLMFVQEMMLGGM